MSLKLSTYLNTIYHTKCTETCVFLSVFPEHISDHKTQLTSRSRFSIYTACHCFSIYVTHILIHLNTKKHIMFLQSLQEINIYRFTIDLRLHFADSANKIFNLSCSKDGISEQDSKYITEYGFKSQYKIKKFFTFEASNIYFPILLELTINHEILPVFLISGIPNSHTKFALRFYTHPQPCTGTVYLQSNIWVRNFQIIVLFIVSGGFTKTLRWVKLTCMPSQT